MITVSRLQRYLRALPLLLLLFSCEGRAETVVLPLPNGVDALADFRGHDPQRPAILLLHGFLQTHNFPLIQSLADELAGSGYTVLAPTLTLNISSRKASLTCDAIQSHYLQDQQLELESWLAWLEGRGYRRFILLGHSSGGMRLASFLAGGTRYARQIEGVIYLSLTYLADRYQVGDLKSQLRLAERALARPGNRIESFTLAFCRGNYRAPADAFLSYVEWDGERLIAALQPERGWARVILGSADQRLPSDWAGRLRRAGHEVVVIEGADHFFNGGAEFDLLDSVLEVLAAHTGGEG